MAKRTDIDKEILIPEDVEVEFNEGKMVVKGEKGSLSREFTHPRINIKVDKDKVKVNCKKPRKKEKALAGTYIAHIKNMVKGVTKGFKYKMKTVFSHFPIKTSVEGDEVLIKNFIGERSPRRVRIPENVDVKIDGEEITVTGADKEKVGQTVANIERAGGIKNRDIRVFQDGIYIVEKGG